MTGEDQEWLDAVTAQLSEPTKGEIMRYKDAQVLVIIVGLGIAGYLAYKQRYMIAVILAAIIASPLDDMVLAWLITRGK